MLAICERVEGNKDIIRREPGIYLQLIIEVSKAAKDNGMVGESSQLTRMLLELGWSDAAPPMEELVKLMIEAQDFEALQDMCDRILKKGSHRTAILLMRYLMEKSPELAAKLAKNFINAMPVEMVAKVARAVVEKVPEEGVAQCRMRMNEDILRSHVYYDKVVFLLVAIRDLYAAKGNEEKWVGFIRRFAAENKGKRKLIEMMRKQFGAVL